MPVATGTMEHENGVGLVARAWQMAGTWIPAYAGMTVGVVVKDGFQTRPYACWLAEGYLQRICGHSLVRWAAVIRWFWRLFKRPNTGESTERGSATQRDVAMESA